MLLEHSIMPEGTVPDGTVPANQQFGQKKLKKFRRLRMTLPHVFLIILLCFYIVSGAYVLYKLELPVEQELKTKGLLIIDEHQKIFENILFNAFFNESSNFTSSSLLDGENAYELVFRSTFRNAVDIYTRSAFGVVKNNLLDHSQLFGDDAENLWTLSSSILFAFSIITTIGWGNISPVTFYGKLFCIIYGLVGIPFAMLVIANIGKFLSEAFNFALTIRKRFVKKFRCVIYELRNRNKIQQNINNNNVCNNKASVSGTDTIDPIDQEAIDKPLSFLWVLLIVFLYLCLGGLVLPVWENLNFFDAFYFAFVSITTTGFGDIVPVNETYLALTLVYIAVGVAFTTISVELAAGYMRKLHYVGRQITGAKFALVRFGGQEMTMADLLNVLGKKYNIPGSDLHKLTDNFDDFIESALKGEIDCSADDKSLLPNGMIGRGGSIDCTGNWMENWLQELNQPVERLKGPFTISDEDIRYIDDERLVSTV